MPIDYCEKSFESAAEHYLIISVGYKKEDCVKIRTDALIEKIWEFITMLREYRTTLISVAVTGKIDVREGCLT